jgi:hypothetical protein
MGSLLSHQSNGSVLSHQSDASLLSSQSKASVRSRRSWRAVDGHEASGELPDLRRVATPAIALLSATAVAGHLWFWGRRRRRA